MAVMLAAAATAKSAVVGKVSSEVRDVFAGLLGGMTKNDQERLARVRALLDKANAGDSGALLQLAYNAFESASLRLPGDNRAGLQGMSPPNVREWSKKALQEYARSKGGLPPSLRAYAERLNAPVIPNPPTFAEQVRGAIVEGAQSGAAQGVASAATAEAGTIFQRYRPWIIGGAVVIAGVIAWRMWGRK